MQKKSFLRSSHKVAYYQDSLYYIELIDLR